MSVQWTVFCNASRQVVYAFLQALGLGGIIAMLGACSLNGLVDNTELPGDLKDPKAVKTEVGALGVYRRAVLTLASSVAAGDGTDPSGGFGTGQRFYPFAVITGILTDELQVFPSASGFPESGFPGQIDTRNMQASSLSPDEPHRALQRLRGLTREGIGALRKYAPTAPVALHGHLFAIEGIAEVMLAELYCSGIPLSTVDFEADYTLTRGFSTDEVYAQALSQFDSAAQYATDSARIIHFINLGRARALLGLGQLQAAAAAVTTVPDNYKYLLSYSTSRKKFVPNPAIITQSDREGQNGIPYRSSGDPRITPAVMNETEALVLASGIEARLIEAEAALAAGRSDWLTRLNALRTTCTSARDCPSPAPAGLGGVAGLPPLDDPALAPLPPNKSIADVRVDLLFAERAYWLYLTGHRQGDLRRLVRYYKRPEFSVYPTGLWGAAQITAYGTDVTIAIPQEERRNNSLYKGCFHRDA